MLEKATKRAGNKKFKRPPAGFAKLVVPHLAKILGNDVVVNSDGTLTATTPDGKKIQKEIIANKAYYMQMLDYAKEHPEKLPIPKVVLKPMILLLEAFVKIW